MYFFQLIPNWLNSCLKKLLLKRVIRKLSQKFPGLFLKKKGLNSPLPKHMARKSKFLVLKSFNKALNEFILIFQSQCMYLIWDFSFKCLSTYLVTMCNLNVGTYYLNLYRKVTRMEIFGIEVQSYSKLWSSWIKLDQTRSNRNKSDWIELNWI